jgi:hypothetical protein
MRKPFMSNEWMNSDSAAMLASPALETAESGAMELSEDELDSVAGGCGFNFGDLAGFDQSSGNFYSKKSFGAEQMTFAGPEGSGTMSTIGMEEINSGAFQNISARA